MVVPRTRILAHRGASRVTRENTIAAFRAAVEQGADGVELDVRRTRDGHLVVHHDAVLPDGRVLAELRRGELPDDVPDLASALDACRPLLVNVEIKNDRDDPDFDPTDSIADAVADALVARPEPVERWLVSSFRLATIDRLRAIAPAIGTAWLVERIAADRLAERVERLVRSGHAALHPSVAGTTAPLVSACHDAGLAVNVWTCNDEGCLRSLLSLGVDGIVTDVPDMALRVRAAGQLGPG